MANAEPDRTSGDGAIGAPEPISLALVAEQRSMLHPVPRRWLPNPEQVWLAARWAAGLILVVWLVAWPFGTMLAIRETTGVWQFGLGYSGAVVILALSNALLVLAGGYLLRASLRLEATAERLHKTVDHFEPAIKADKVKADVALLGGELDKALGKLATAERQIREQVGAIDAAADTLSQGTTSGTDRLAKERQALIDATRAMNAEADAFAEALKKRTSSAEAAELPKLDESLKRLETVSTASAEQYASLREAMAETNALFRETPKGLADELQGSAETLRDAQKALIEESEKLRLLIDQQRSRADSLGRTLAEQTEKLKVRKSPAQGAAQAAAGPVRALGGSWRRILDKVETEVAEKPALISQPVPDASGPSSATPEERERLERMQRFSMALRARLFGMPPEQDRRRFEAGERQIFVRELLACDPIELRARLRAAVDADQGLSEASEEFLSDFDQILAPVMATGDEAAQAALQDMLKTPMGRLYVAIGTARGHFD